VIKSGQPLGNYLRVLVSAKFILDGFCKHVNLGNFPEWYDRFTNVTDVPVAVSDEVEAASVPLSLPLLVGTASAVHSEIPTNQTLDTDNWRIVKDKKGHSMRKTHPVNKAAQISCKNRFSILNKQEPNSVDASTLKNVSGLWNVRSKNNSQTKLTKKHTFNDTKVASSIKSNKSLSSNNHSIQDTCDLRQANISDLCTSEEKTVEEISCLVIGDSLLRYSGRKLVEKGAVVDVNPGAKIVDIKHLLVSKYVSTQPKNIVIHVGTNNLALGYRGKPGYDGGWGKREALHSMADLLSTTRQLFPNSKIILSGVLLRGDITYYHLNHFNEQLYMMCINFGITFVNANRVLRWNHLAQDGRHLNYVGNTQFGNFISRRLFMKPRDVSSLPKEPLISTQDYSPRPDSSGNEKSHAASTPG
jgi:hypothetical protein